MHIPTRAELRDFRDAINDLCSEGRITAPGLKENEGREMDRAEMNDHLCKVFLLMADLYAAKGRL